MISPFHLNFKQYKGLNFVAPDVQQLFSLLLPTRKRRIQTYKRYWLTSVLVESVKQQQQQIEELQKLALKKDY